MGKLHDKYPNAKVIVTSGYSDDPVLANYNQYGFVGAIAKPFHLREVAAIVNDIFDS